MYEALILTISFMYESSLLLRDFFFFFFNDPPPPEISPLSLPDPLPIWSRSPPRPGPRGRHAGERAGRADARSPDAPRSEEHTSELQSQSNLVCRLLLEKKKKRLNQQLLYERQHRK